ncbi:MAG: glycosyltransferase [Leucobacter sp.]
MNRRVCFVINQLGGIGSGGSDRVVSVLANELDARGWSVDICALTDDRTIARELKPGIRTRFIKPIRVPFRPLQILLRMLKGTRLVAAYRREHPEALIVSFIAWVNICATIGSLGYSGGLVLSERTDPATEPGSAVARKVRDLCYQRADRLVFQTPDAMRYFNSTIQSRGRVIGNPVSGGLPQWQPKPGARTIVAASRLEVQKNIPLLLKAFERFRQAHPDYRLIVFGEGKQRTAMEQLLQSLRIADAVDLPGHASDLHDRLKTGTMFVMSSDYEGMPNSLLEAMSMGMPVISTDCPVGGPRMLITDNENGILTPVGDVEALSNAMDKLATDPELANHMAQRASETGTAYDLRNIASEWEIVLSELSVERESRVEA